MIGLDSYIRHIGGLKSVDGTMTDLQNLHLATLRSACSFHHAV